MKKLFVLISFVALLLSVNMAMAGVITPELVEGNPKCADIQCTEGDFSSFKIDPPASGTWDVGGGQITVDIDGLYFDWSATDLEICAVIVKGGPHANVYYYDGQMSDTGLHAPVNASGGFAGLSHIEFCYGAHSVPEPGILLLLGLGLGAVSLASRRKKN